MVFLLDVTCFLHPSDLHRIPFSSVRLDTSTGILYSEVHCPKEKRQHRRIIISFEVKAHHSSKVCPVTTYQLIVSQRPHDSLDTLFVHSRKPTVPLSDRTIQKWIQSLLRLSITEKRIKLRLIASSLALKADGITTMGNWSSSTVFENHYRREHLSQFDFSNTLINLEDDKEAFANDDDGDDELFFGAVDQMDCD